jgi:vanillate O-demethylase ferredoxin subunit
MSTVSAKATLDVRIRSMTRETDDILSFDLVDLQDRDLPEFSAGAHLDVHIAEGLVRQYSLSNDPAERNRYEIAVLNERSGRGGSKALHENSRPGRVITVSAPRNHFPLADGAKRHLLLAGGIGVTPMMAMIATLEARGADWRMHYCTRSSEKTAFLSRLKPFVAAGKVLLHHDGGDPKKGLDISATLKEAKPGTHLYYCGPSGFMAAVADAAKRWPAGSVHYEFFNSPADRPAETRTNTPFQIKLKSTGEVLDVPADKSIVQVLRDKGHAVDTSCEEGYCGTCLTRYIEGAPEHRDTVLDADDRAQYVLICCARSNSPLLVLDI